MVFCGAAIVDASAGTLLAASAGSNVVSVSRSGAGVNAVTFARAPSSLSRICVTIALVGTKTASHNYVLSTDGSGRLVVTVTTDIGGANTDIDFSIEVTEL